MLNAEAMPGVSCPVCGDTTATIFLKRERVPVHQNLLYADPDAARAAVRGRLEMAVCPSCGFVFNAAFDESLLCYGEGYDNAQTHSACFVGHVDDLVRHLVEERGVRGARIVEVGCGQGDFLRRLVAADPGNSGVGFDPSFTGEAVPPGGRLRFERRYYGPDCADTPADVVVCRHVIEHVAHPRQVLAAVRGALGASRAAAVFFETPCVEWILRNRVIWDFFYEHCSLFSAGSLAAAFRLSGFTVRGVHHVFGGQYLWLDGVAAATPGEAGDDGGRIASLARSYGLDEQHWIDAWRQKIELLGGRVAVWGAGAKGATFASLIDADCNHIDSVVDINPAKQGKFIPGTGHPIVACEELAERGVTDVILMNTNYRTEIEALLSRCGLNVVLHEEA